MIEVNKLSKVVRDLSLMKFNGIINVGGKKRSDYDVFGKYFKKLKKTSRKKIQKKLNYFITKDSSLKLSKLHKLQIRV